MSTIKAIWERIRRDESVNYPTFQIKAGNILDKNDNVGKLIIPQGNYFSISLTEQFLKYKREYWNEYIPMTLFFAEFIYGGKRQDFPFVVGPELLKKIEQMEGNESVRYKNTRVIGPTPYNGDNVALFTALFRIKTKDWAAQAINLLETVANSFDASKLTNYLSIAEPLLTGIEGFFNMGKQIQFRLGQRDEYRDSTVQNTNPFRSGYWVMLRKDQNEVNQDHFWVKDNTLCYGTDPENLVFFQECDYTLFEISALEKRGDYQTFDFHRHWERAKEAVIQKNLKEADRQFQSLTAKLYLSNDIIDSQKNQLQTMYLTRFNQLKDKFLPKTLNNNLQEFATNGLESATTTSKWNSLDKKIIDLAAHFSKETAKEFEANNFEINESFIEKELDSEFLNKAEIVNMKSSQLERLQESFR